MHQLTINASSPPKYNLSLEERCLDAFEQAGDLHTAARLLNLPWYQVRGVLARSGVDLTSKARPIAPLTPEEMYFKSMIPEALHSSQFKNPGNTNFTVGNLNVQVTKATKSGTGWTIYVGHLRRKPDVCVGIMFDADQESVERIIVVPAEQATKQALSVRESGANWCLTMPERELPAALSHLQK
jgi:hypothetical protein